MSEKQVFSIAEYEGDHHAARDGACLNDKTLTDPPPTYEQATKVLPAYDSARLPRYTRYTRTEMMQTEPIPVNSIVRLLQTRAQAVSCTAQPLDRDLQQLQSHIGLTTEQYGRIATIRGALASMESAAAVRYTQARLTADQVYRLENGARGMSPDASHASAIRDLRKRLCDFHRQAVRMNDGVSRIEGFRREYEEIANQISPASSIGGLLSFFRRR